MRQFWQLWQLCKVMWTALKSHKPTSISRSSRSLYVQGSLQQMISMKLIELPALQSEAWTITHSILSSSEAAAEAKLFAATTLKGKVWRRGRLVWPLLIFKDHIRLRPVASGIFTVPTRFSSYPSQYILRRTKTHTDTAMRLSSKSRHSDAWMERCASACRIHLGK